MWSELIAALLTLTTSAPALEAGAASALDSSSAAVCPPGPQRGLFVQAFRLSPAANARLFPGDLRVRIVALGRSRFVGPEIRSALGRLASVAGSEFEGGGADMAFFRDSFATALLANHRDGVAIFTEARPRGFRVHVCTVVDSVPIESARRDIGASDMLVVHAALFGQDHALTLRVTAVPRDSLLAWQKEFMRGTAAVVASTPIALEPSIVDDRLLRCLTETESRKN